MGTDEMSKDETGGLIRFETPGFKTIQFIVDDWMPCSPKDIKVDLYGLPDVCQTDALIEAAARVIMASVEAKCWVWTSWKNIIQTMFNEMKMFKEYGRNYPHLPRSIVYERGGTSVAGAIGTLMDRKLIQHKVVLVDNMSVDIVRPTAKLVEFIMLAQGVTDAEPVNQTKVPAAAA